MDIQPKIVRFQVCGQEVGAEVYEGPERQIECAQCTEGHHPSTVSLWAVVGHPHFTTTACEGCRAPKLPGLCQWVKYERIGTVSELESAGSAR